MTDRPILFSAPMVRALLEGRKTQTRRVLKKPAAMDALHVFKPAFLMLPGNADLLPFAPGDRLWVREAWRFQLEYEHLPGGELPQMRSMVEYDLEVRKYGSREAGRYRHARFMPRWASRLTLLVTDVRVERLRNISEADAIAEGVTWQEPTDEDRAWAKEYAEEYGGDDDIQGVWIVPGTDCGFGPKPRQPVWGPTAANCYSSLWDSINGHGAWEANPWVVAVSFNVIKGNIDG